MLDRRQFSGQLQVPGKAPSDVVLYLNEVFPPEQKKVKESSETKNNDATRAVDADFTVNNKANVWYRYELFLRTLAVTATPNLSYDFVIPGSSVGEYTRHTTDAAAANTADVLQWPNTGTVTLAANQASIVHIIGTFKTDTSGNVQFRWAQATSDTANLTIFNGSFVRFTEMV